MIILQRATIKNLEEIAEMEREASSKTYFAKLGDEELRIFLDKNFVFFIKNNDISVGLIAYRELEENTVYIKSLVIK